MSNILLTGGRAPVTLALARLFAHTGHTVIVAESAPHHLCRSSHAVWRNYQVPPPRTATAAYLDALVSIVQNEQIDYLIPTCEEIFYVAQGRARLAAHCHVLVDTLAQLHRVHNKWTFIEQARQLNLPVPATYLLTSRDALTALGVQLDAFVLKPVYSRFATAAHLPPHAAPDLRKIIPTPQAAWLAQEWVDGEHFCTYSVAQQGNLVAHATYPVTFKAGQGAAIVFTACDHPQTAAQTLAWVQHFVQQTQFHGQIAFDFIQRPTGELLAIECNPRATSGLHLFGTDPHLVDALLGHTMALVTPMPGPPTMLALAMLLYGWSGIHSVGALGQWASTFWRGQDVIFQRDDPWPWFAQFASMWQFWQWSRQQQVGLVAATTLDIEWNGETSAEYGMCGCPLGVE
jgi:hypothetical protein